MKKIDKLINKANTLGGNIYENAEILNSFRSSHYPRNLPIEKYNREFLYTMAMNEVVIVLGETGCGKTTKMPEMIMQGSNMHYRIAHILPKKIAVVSIANRVAKNMGLVLGKEVGYSIRFDYNYSNETKLKFTTEGMFIREMLISPLIEQYDIVIIDDCHEKSLNTEILFALLKIIQEKRVEKKLKIIISSATLDYKAYVSFFRKNNDKINIGLFYVSGRNYPVDIFYLNSPCENYVKSALMTMLSIHKNNPKSSGDVLVFMPGMEEIELFMKMFEQINSNNTNDILLFPLAGSMPNSKTLEVFNPAPMNKRKVIISTNIAEASITIDNIAFVIDCCFTKMKFYNYETDTDHMLIVPASQFSLQQRAGRAGRTRPGQCFRLIQESDYNQLSIAPLPEIQRSNLRDFILQLKSFGIKNINKLNLLTEIDNTILGRSLETLFLLGIIDKETSLTPLGKKACDMPIDCRLAVTLLSSYSTDDKFNCVSEVLAIVSMLSVNNLFFQINNPERIMKAKQSKGMIEGDHLSLLSLFKIFKSIKGKNQKQTFCYDCYLNYFAMKEAEKINENLKTYLKKYNINIQRSLDQDGEDILKAFLKGFFLNVAQKQGDNSYRSLRWNYPLHIHPTSVLYSILPEYVVFNEVTVTAKNYMKEVSIVKKEWIVELANGFYVDKTEKTIDDNRIREMKRLDQYTNINYQQKQFGVINNQLFNKQNDTIDKVIVIDNEATKQNDYSQYFNREKRQNKLNPQSIIKKEVENQIETSLKPPLISSSYSKEEEEDIETITMLRRKRNKEKTNSNSQSITK